MDKIYPVVMCGGSGTRLWPACRPSRPKQFMLLAGNRSPFQEAVARVAPLVEAPAELIVIGGEAHRDTILDQLAVIGVSARLLLEPQGRDSAAAMAAAAVWTASRDRDGINVFVASDHHIPDHAAFREAIRLAVPAAEQGRIVTLGVVPTHPSSSYGYIAPTAPGFSDVRAFVEKPVEALAAGYIQDGYLWNSGNFVARAATLGAELAQHAPEVLAAASQAVQERRSSDGTCLLGDAFLAAPRISIDYALMERTSHASVLPVTFDWSDLGTWDTVQATGDGGLGSHVLEDAEGCLIRAPDGVLVAAVGVRDLAIVVETDAVLVSSLSRSPEMRKVVDRIAVISPQHLDFASVRRESLADGTRRLGLWLRRSALPIWSTLGQAEDGVFAEALTLDGRRIVRPHRARVQSRQIQVFAEAGRLGWEGPWRRAVLDGMGYLRGRYLRPDGLMRTLLNEDGEPLDDTAMLYDQAFLLFAQAAVQAGDGLSHTEAEAVRARQTLLAHAPASGGLIEGGEHPYQSNAHMHLLEACLAWEEAGGDGEWSILADRVVELALSRFIDAESGFLREYFASDWSPAPGPDGALVEPGHQFEWAWLLTRHGKARRQDATLDVARRLYAHGAAAIDRARGVAIDAVSPDGSPISLRARLWPQTEWLKASLILAEETAVTADRAAYLENAERALAAVWKYLSPEGLWRDKLLESGAFIEEPSPATSLYHIMACYGQIVRSASLIDPAMSDALRP